MTVEDIEGVEYTSRVHTKRRWIDSSSKNV
jgi:hypothetical protein